MVSIGSWNLTVYSPALTAHKPKPISSVEKETTSGNFVSNTKVVEAVVKPIAELFLSEIPYTLVAIWSGYSKPNIFLNPFITNAQDAVSKGATRKSSSNV